MRNLGLSAELALFDRTASGLRVYEPERAREGNERGPIAPEDEELLGRIVEAALFESVDGSSMPSVAESEGSELAPTVGRYVLRRHIGSGAMGSVYAAEDPLLGREVAVKLLHYGRHDHARLRREGAALARLSHPNVVPVFDVGEDGGRTFVVMELIDGRSLLEWLRDGARSPDEILGVFEQAGRGLAAAHEAGLIHRDFKPSNVLVDSAGRVLVADFGLARVVDLVPEPLAGADVGELVTSNTATSDRTETNAVVGTPGYMAPEQWTHGRIDARSDQFGFCVALYEALFGCRPFTGSGRASYLRSIEAQRLDPLPGHDVPGRALSAIRRGLRSDPDDRWPSMDALLAGLFAPRTRRVGWVLVAALFLGLASTMAWADLLATDDACERSAALWNEIWTPVRRQGIVDALSSSGAPNPRITATTVDRGLERYADEWAIAHARVCEAAKDDRLEASVVESRLSCLTRAAWGVDSLAALLGDADSELIDRAVELVSGLEDPMLCETGRGERTHARTEAERPEVDRLRRRVTQAQVIAEAGFVTRVEGWIPELASRAEALDDPRSRLEIELLRGTIANNGDRFEAAALHYEQAYLLAVALGYDRAAARALEHLPLIIGYQLRRGDEGERWAQLALAFATRAHGHRRLEISALRARATFAGLRDDTEESLRLYERALARSRADATEPTVSEGRLLADLGMARISAGYAEPGLASLRDGIAMMSELLGPLHPEVARLEQNLGAWLGMLGRVEEALIPLRAAKASLERRVGPEHIDTLHVTGNIGAALVDLGRWSEARSVLEQSILVLESASPPDAFALGNALNNLSRIEIEQGNLERAEQLALRALLVVRDSTFAETGLYVDSLAMLTEVLLSTGRGDEALAELESRVTEWTRAQTRPMSIVLLRLCLGHVLVELGRDEEARPHLEVEMLLEGLDRYRTNRARALVDLARIEFRRGRDHEIVARLVERVDVLTAQLESFDAKDLRARAQVLVSESASVSSRR